MPYQPTRNSLQNHPLPGWFAGAKLGIFVHWGLYSVPAWAPTTGEFSTVTSVKGWRYWFENNPYAEWYQNSLRIAGSPTAQYHAAAYGSTTPYEAFAPMFKEAVQTWKPVAWAEFFARVGARYVVQTTKHHDGFLMWNSRTPNPQRADYRMERDLVGELAQAVRQRGMKMGLYYSGGPDWTFNPRPVTSLDELLLSIPATPEYARYVEAHWRELIERYQPDVLWNDIGYPAGGNPLQLFADYYNTVADGVVNDRFTQVSLGEPGTPRYRLASLAMKAILPAVMRLAGAGSAPTTNPADFTTPEYSTLKKINLKKWEATRGMGYSFGYNRNETEAHMLTPDALVRLLVDVVSKNGNLLLNIGPCADGSISELQTTRLHALGGWLQVNGEAIFDTSPWVQAEGRTRQGTALRFTRKGNIVNIFIMEPPSRAEVDIDGMPWAGIRRCVILGSADPVQWQQSGGRLSLRLPADLPPSPVQVVQVEISS